MERIAILDHDTHILFVEDIDEDILNNQYWGEEERYIKDNYNLKNYSWDYIVDAQYFPEGESDPYEINFEDIKDT